MNQYQVLLKAPEWIRKRNGIVKRDKNTCTSCGNDKLYDGASLGVAVSIKETNEWLIISPKSYEEAKFKKVFVSKTKFTYIPEFAPILMMPYTDEDGKGWMNMIALKNADDRDEMMMFIWAEYKPKDPANAQNKERIAYYYQALQEYKEHIKGKWDYVFGLHVHHKYYQLSRKPWEYPDNALTTLCWQCHTELHQNQSIPVLDENGNSIGLYRYCSRCHGAGWFPKYKHVESGICFRCNGAKYEELIV